MVNRLLSNLPPAESRLPPQWPHGSLSRPRFRPGSGRNLNLARTRFCFPLRPLHIIAPLRLSLELRCKSASNAFKAWAVGEPRRESGRSVRSCRRSRREQRFRMPEIGVANAGPPRLPLPDPGGANRSFLRPPACSMDRSLIGEPISSRSSSRSASSPSRAARRQSRRNIGNWMNRTSLEELEPPTITPATKKVILTRSVSEGPRDVSLADASG